MTIALGIKNLLAFIALGLGIVALISPRHIHFIVAAFLIAYAAFSFGWVR